MQYFQVSGYNVALSDVTLTYAQAKELSEKSCRYGCAEVNDWVIPTLSELNQFLSHVAPNRLEWIGTIDSAGWVWSSSEGVGVGGFWSMSLSSSSCKVLAEKDEAYICLLRASQLGRTPAFAPRSDLLPAHAPICGEVLNAQIAEFESRLLSAEQLKRLVDAVSTRVISLGGCYLFSDELFEDGSFIYHDGDTWQFYHGERHTFLPWCFEKDAREFLEDYTVDEFYSKFSLCLTTHLTEGMVFVCQKPQTCQTHLETVAHFLDNPHLYGDERSLRLALRDAIQARDQAILKINAIQSRLAQFGAEEKA